MKAKVYIGAKKYAVYIGRKIVEKTMNFFSFPARFFATKDGVLKDYKIYGNIVQSNLPEEYTQLEYLEGTGSQYIITDFFFDDISADTLTCDFMRTGTGAGSLLYGCRDAYKVNGYGFQFNDTGRTYRQYGDSDTGLGSTYVFNLNTRYTAAQTGYTYVIGGRTSAVVVETAPVQNYPLTVFATRNADQPTTAITPMRLYNLNVVNASGKMIFNLVPARRNDGVLGLYDTVKGRFYTNAGTGEFLTDGEAQPTPTNPIEIKSVGDKTVNLFNKETITKGKYISQAGAVTSNNSFCYGDYISVVPNHDYIISGTNKGGTAYRRIHGYGADQKWIQQIKALQVQSGADYTMTFTVPEGCAYIRFSGMSSTNNYEETNIVQIQEGSVVTEYEPYGMYKIPVVVKSKNLFDKSNALLGYGIGTTGIIAPTTQYNCSNYIEVKPDTTYLRLNNETPLGNYYHLYDKDKNWIERRAATSTGLMTTSADTKYIAVAIDLSVSLDTYQIVEGDTATAYEPYFNETTDIYLSEPLRKLDDYTDYIDFTNQKVVRQVGVVNGSTFTWTKGSYNGTGYYTKFNNYTPTPVNTDTKATAITEITTTYTRNVAYNGGQYLSYACFMSSTGNLILITREETSPKCDIYYGKITPTEESITLPSIALQQGNLSMDVETKIKPSQLTITGDIDDVR